MQLDMAVRNELAAAHALEAASGSSLIRVVRRSPVRFATPDVEPMHPDLALTLVKRLFAAGLHLTALQALLGSGALSDRVGTVVEQLDLVIKEIRKGVTDEAGWEAG